MSSAVTLRMIGKWCLYLDLGKSARPRFAQDSHPPARLAETSRNHLVQFGGFPEPFSRSDRMFLRKWRQLRFEQLMREDIRKDTSLTCRLFNGKSLADLTRPDLNLEFAHPLPCKIGSVTSDFTNHPRFCYTVTRKAMRST